MFDFFHSIFTTVMYPLELAVAWIMVTWHSMLSAIGMDPASGWTWALSIVGLVIVIRILLIPLFVKQIKASRALQLLQPEMRKLQAKYKGKTDPVSREAMSKEMFALYREHKANPLSSCMPILLQSPIFFALFRVLNGIPKEQTIGPLNAELVKQADQATIFGAQISDTFVSANSLSTRIITVALIVMMSATTFFTSRQLMMKNMPKEALEGQFAQQQKIMLYLLPAVFAISGVNFPIGVLIYWLTTNLWSMGQQFYVIRRMPAPGSAAEKAYLDRRKRQGKETSNTVTKAQSLLKGSSKVDVGVGDTTTEEGSGATDSGPVRNQPKKKPRSKRSGGAQGKRPSASG